MLDKRWRNGKILQLNHRARSASPPYGIRRNGYTSMNYFHIPEAAQDPLARSRNEAVTGDPADGFENAALSSDWNRGLTPHQPLGKTDSAADVLHAKHDDFPGNSDGIQLPKSATGQAPVRQEVRISDQIEELKRQFEAVARPDDWQIFLNIFRKIQELPEARRTALIAFTQGALSRTPDRYVPPPLPEPGSGTYAKLPLYRHFTREELIEFTKEQWGHWLQCCHKKELPFDAITRQQLRERDKTLYFRLAKALSREEFADLIQTKSQRSQAELDALDATTVQEMYRTINRLQKKRGRLKVAASRDPDVVP